MICLKSFMLKNCKSKWISWEIPRLRRLFIYLVYSPQGVSKNVLPFRFNLTVIYCNLTAVQFLEFMTAKTQGLLHMGQMFKLRYKSA
jgi:hypothetical protein